jgi:hypothetical protein
MTARKQSSLIAFLDWVVRGPEPLSLARQAPPARQASARQPPTREARGDNNLFALLCRLTC